MSANKVAVALKGSHVGAWIPVTRENATGDVHVYVGQPEKGAVLGKNKNYRDRIQFSDIAVLIKENEIIVQYADAKGEPVQKVIQPEVFVTMYDNFLHACKDYAEGLDKPKERTEFGSD